MAHASSSTSTTRVESISAELTRRILSADLPPRSRLPTVRELARTYEVNIATIQRVVARLEAIGLVEVRHGSGATILDTRRAGGVDLLPFALEAAAADPAKAGRLLSDFLETRRALATEVIFRRLTRMEQPDLTPIRIAFQTFAQLTEQPDADIRELAAADVEISRRLVLAVEQSAVLCILNILERVYLANDTLLGVAFANPEMILSFWRAALDLFDQPELLTEQIPALRQLLELMDRSLVDNYIAALTEANNPAHAEPSP